MSTCPNPDLFSALYDGEVPSPWKEKLESHLAHCDRCATRFTRYGTIGKALKAGFKEPETTQEWLDRSFERLSARAAERSGEAFSGTSFSGRSVSPWSKRSVRLSLPALAAMLVAAIVLPSALVMVASGKDEAPVSNAMAAVLPAQALTVSRDTPVYSTDTLPQSVAGQLLVSNQQQLFTMVDYARQFSTDESLFDDAQIIIIKLPDLTHFGGSEDPIITNKDTLQSVASFSK